MKPFEPNLSSLAVARDILLTPFGLDEGKLLKALGTMFTHKVDYADLYFQFTKSEGWSLEEGIVKTGSFPSTRAWACAPCPATRRPFPIRTRFPSGPAGCGGRHAHHRARGAGKVKVAGDDGAGRPLAVPAARSARLAGRHRQGAAAGTRRKDGARQDPRVVQVMASLAGEYDVVLVLRSDGVLAADIRPLVRVSLTVIAEQNGRRETGSAGGGGRYAMTISAMPCWNSMRRTPSIRRW
jgi:TldD protein